MAQTATGEDVFSESPFFFNRLRHVLFGWYPRPLVERSGAFSMRQYYSPSGDHIRLGYVGDTQPYQAAAVLCSRYRETPVAQAVRWLGGTWPKQWMQYTLRWAVLGEWDSIPPREPSGRPGDGESLITSQDIRPKAPVGLAYLDAGCNTAYVRSDWSGDATWILFENAPFVSAHDSLDSGTFEIFKGDILAARTGNLDHANVGAAHTMNYLHRTIAGNCLLIEDPAEKWKGFLGGAEGGSDEGGERTNFPLSSSADANTYQDYRDIFRRGQIVRFRHTKDLTYALGCLHTELQAVLGERESEDVVGAGGVVGQPVHRGAQHQRADLQHPRLGVGQRFHAARRVADVLFCHLIHRPARQQRHGTGQPRGREMP
jgi:hypothetical protein